ncbi:MAG: hypothetical protein ACLPRE_04920 [Limisphaerales bacterium]
MKAHVEIYIRLALDGGKTLHDVLRQFACDSKGWVFPQAESETYQKHIGGEGGYLILKPGKGIKPALVAIATAKVKQPNTFYVANIVPRDCFQLTIVEYNAIGLAFVRDSRKWFRKSAFDGSVHCTNANKTLADIIPAEKCRKYFEQYLNCSIWNSTTLPTHPSDIQKLDVFICALFRYGADVRLDEIESYLIADRKWTPADAAWVRVRMEIGLDVLKVYRKF